MRAPFAKRLADVPTEQAHGGSGSRQLLLSSADAVSPNLEAMTKGFLPVGASYDWHGHERVDEFFLTTHGEGRIDYKDGSSFPLSAGSLVYSPADLAHHIENTGAEIMEFFFIRVKA